MALLDVSKKGKSAPKQKSTKKAIPKTVQQTIHYEECYENGVIQIEPGVFSKTFRFDDISFKTRSDEDQEEIYESYLKFLNSIVAGEDLYFTVVNSQGDKKTGVEAVVPEAKGDAFDEYREEMAAMIREKFESSRNNIVTKKYITVVVKSTEIDKAMRRLRELSGEIESNFKKVTKDVISELTLAERLEVLNTIMNGAEPNYWFEHDINGGVSVDFARMAKQNLTTKDLIAPEVLKFAGNDFQIGENRFGQIMYLDKIANWMNTNFLADLCEVNFESTITMHIESIPQQVSLKLIHNQSVNITAEVMEKQKSMMKNGYSPEMISADLKNAKDQIDDLQDDLMNRDQKLFYMSLVLAHFAEDRDHLKENSKTIRSIGSKYMSEIKPLMMQQERGLRTVLPFGKDETYVKKLLTTESLGIFIPFDEANTMDKGGFYYGVNSVNKSIIVYNRMRGQNYNGLVLGASGSGKSFSAKREMCSAIMQTNADVYIIDPDGEYTPIAEAFGGTVVKIAPGNNVYINPFDLDVDTSHDSDSNPIAMKMDFICGMLETMIGSNAKLTPTQKSIVDRCIRQIYAPYLEHLNNMPVDANGRKPTIDRNYCPTMQSLFDALLSQPQPEAQSLALIMESYTTGTFDTFAHRTNVNLDSRLVVYDIKNIGTNLRELGLKVCMNDVWNKMMENRRFNKWTWFYIDEFHLLMSNGSTSEFLKSVWKRARKWQGVPTGITQNVEDLLASPDARAIINNSSFVYMLNQSMMDRAMLKEILNLSDNDLEFVTNVEPGHGLIKTGKQAIPFEDKFPTNTKLYKVMTTKADNDQ